MRPDPYATSGVDPQRLIAELRRDLDQLAAEVRSRPGLTITQASSAFLIPQTSTPPAPSGAVYLYYDGATLRVRTPAGSYSTEPPDIPQAAHVAAAANITTGSAPSSYSQSYMQGIYEAAVNIKDQFNAARIALINSTLMASS